MSQLSLISLSPEMKLTFTKEMKELRTRLVDPCHCPRLRQAGKDLVFPVVLFYANMATSFRTWCNKLLWVLCLHECWNWPTCRTESPANTEDTGVQIQNPEEAWRFQYKFFWGGVSTPQSSKEGKAHSQITRFGGLKDRTFCVFGVIIALMSYFKYIVQWCHVCNALAS